MKICHRDRMWVHAAEKHWWSCSTQGCHETLIHKKEEISSNTTK
jgi:hypothetical protein